MIRIGVIGAGAWGTALALTAKRTGAHVSVIAKDPPISNTLEKEGILTTQDLSKVETVHVIVVAIPTQFIPNLLEEIKPFMHRDHIFVVASKGIHIQSGKFITELMTSAFPDMALTVLSGPNFAHEIVQNLPAASTLGYQDRKAADTVMQALSHPNFRLYMNPDILGVQIGGAIKNVLAVACGFLRGLSLGENAMASLITRGLTEMRRFALHKGAKEETLFGLSGMGDIMLTCMGNRSRNVVFGMEYILHQNVDKALAAVGATVEGYYTTEAICKLADDLKVDMPICQTVYAILYKNADPLEAMNRLMRRPIKHEL